MHDRPGEDTHARPEGITGTALQSIQLHETFGWKWVKIHRAAENCQAVLRCGCSVNVRSNMSFASYTAIITKCDHAPLEQIASGDNGEKHVMVSMDTLVLVDPIKIRNPEVWGTTGFNATTGMTGMTGATGPVVGIRSNAPLFVPHKSNMGITGATGYVQLKDIKGVRKPLPPPPKPSLLDRILNVFRRRR